MNAPGMFDPLLYGAGIALAASALGTPVLWRTARGLPPAPRVAVTVLAGLGLTGLVSLPPALWGKSLDEIPLIALALSAPIQGLLAPVLLLLARKA